MRRARVLITAVVLATSGFAVTQSQAGFVISNLTTLVPAGCELEAAALTTATDAVPPLIAPYTTAKTEWTAAKAELLQMRADAGAPLAALKPAAVDKVTTTSQTLIARRSDYASALLAKTGVAAALQARNEAGAAAAAAQAELATLLHDQKVAINAVVSQRWNDAAAALPPVQQALVGARAAVVTAQTALTDCNVSTRVPTLTLSFALLPAQTEFCQVTATATGFPSNTELTGVRTSGLGGFNFGTPLFFTTDVDGAGQTNLGQIRKGVDIKIAVGVVNSGDFQAVTC